MTEESKAPAADDVAIAIEDGTFIIRHGNATLALAADNSRVTVQGVGHTYVALDESGKTAAVTQQAPTAGEAVEDGSIYVGVVNGYKVFAAPHDLVNRQAQHLTLTFNDAAAYVKQLNDNNYLGHKDWIIPEDEAMTAVRNNKDKGALKDSFQSRRKLSGDDCPDWYWTATRRPGGFTQVMDMQLSDGAVTWERMDLKRESCRPVRLVKDS